MQPHPMTAERKLALPNRITIDSSVARLRLHELWQFEVGTSIREVAHHPGSAAVFIRCWDGSVHALEESTGSHLWSRRVQLPIGSNPGIWATPYGLLLQHSRESLQFLDGVTGNLLWNQHSAGAIRFHRETPGGLLLIERIAPAGSIYPSILVAIEPLTGVERWRLEQAGYPGAPAFGSDGNLYVADRRRFRCIDPASGKCLWMAPCPAHTVEVAFSPDGMVIFQVVAPGGAVELIALRKSRLRIPGLVESRMVWRRTVSGGIEQLQPTAHGLYLKSRQVLERLDASTGSTTWRLELGENFSLSQLMLHGESVGIATESGLIMADRATGTVLWKCAVPFGGRLQQVGLLDEQLLTAFRAEGRTCLRCLDPATGRQKAETSLPPCRVAMGVGTLLQISGSMVTAARVDAESRPLLRTRTAAS
ncbi:MAG: PQQ-binding-like beta-propeller repeat protein [Armatimonadetes bacterium]|nr:PQQ-binding-like beta-propeller repeat protein [Armatimonadota bacterium]